MGVVRYKRATPTRYIERVNSSRRSEGLGPSKITNRHKTGGNAKFDERNVMSERNSKKRVYMEPNKPVTEMPEEEIRAFAEEMYTPIMGTLPERKVDDEK